MESGKKGSKKAALVILVSIRGEKHREELYEVAHLEWVKRLAERYQEERIEAGGWVRLRNTEVPANWALPELEDVMERVAS